LGVGRPAPPPPHYAQEVDTRMDLIAAGSPAFE